MTPFRLTDTQLRELLQAAQTVAARLHLILEEANVAREFVVAGGLLSYKTTRRTAILRLDPAQLFEPVERNLNHIV